MNFASFIKQKTTIAGVAGILGTASAFMQGTVNLHDAITAAVVSLVLIILPEEKTVTSAEIGSMVTAALGIAAAAEPAKVPAVPAALVEAHQKAQTALVVAQTAALDAHTATLLPPPAPAPEPKPAA